ncbi:MAG: DUF6179 domain-containing protein [Clostridia bacterium]
MDISEKNLSFPESSAQISEAEIMELLKKQALLFTKGQSGSLPVEIMAELRDSIYFTLHEALLAGENPNLGGEALFEKGQHCIEELTERAKELWLMTQVITMPIRQRSYEDTIRSIGSFFSRYQHIFFAHQIPCDIDYPLFKPVPEKNLGVRYIFRWLQQILLENTILREFDKETVIKLLERYCPDYRESIINLCEPVLVNAAGCILVGKPPRFLNITEKERIRIENAMLRKTDEENTALLAQAGQQLCREMGVRSEETANDIIRVIIHIYPRLKAVLEESDSRNIFLSF